MLTEDLAVSVLEAYHRSRTGGLENRYLQATVVARTLQTYHCSISGAPMLGGKCAFPFFGGWIASRMGSGVFKVQEDAAGALQVVDQINLPVVVGAEVDALHVDSREHVLLARGGALVEYKKVSGTWVHAVESDFHGLPVGSHFRLAASRNYFNPATMTGPAQLDVIPDQFGPQKIDCPADIAPQVLGDNSVGVPDLLMVIGNWGPCLGPTAEMCPADIAPAGFGDGQVGVPDLLMIIANWGPCP